MKYLLLIFFLVFIPVICAQTENIVIYKESYYPKETFQAEIFSDNIKATDVSILNSLGYPTNVGINLMKISNNHYFIFFDIPSLSPEAYTLKVKDLQKQFEIKSRVDNILSIYPGAVKYSLQDSPFSKITITNHNIKSETTIISSSSDLVKPSVDSLIIPGKSSKSFYITLDKTQKDNFLANLLINNYRLPVWFIIKEDDSFLEKIEEKVHIDSGLKFYIKSDDQNIYLNYITKEIQESTPITGSIYFKNMLNESLNNLKISLTGNLHEVVKLEFTEINTLIPDEEKELNIIINENRFLSSDSYSGYLKISSDKYTFKLPMDFMVVEEAEEPESLTLEETIEIPKNITDKPEISEKKIEIKWIYLLVLIILFVIVAFILSRKPKSKKLSFKEFISKIKK